MRKRVACVTMLFLFLFSILCTGTGSAPVYAESADGPTEIYTVEDLQAISENPSGSYILMNDLDLAGVEWKCLDFSGTFNGNGNAILNLHLTRPGEQTAVAYDGNIKKYDASFVGLFSTLRNAEVSNLQLVNVQALVDIDTPCFVGGITGYSENSTISGCTVTGCLELRAFDRLFGVAGVAGYGSGTVKNCRVDVTLICTDTDPNTKDEQFMGGVFSTGFIDVLECDVTIDGYSSEYGYAHNGGITGMYLQKPIGVGHRGKIMNNNVSGKITFFECNSDRRAYCNAIAGEILATSFKFVGNQTSFKRDERRDYSVELRPEMCAQPTITTLTVPPGCDWFGYTLYYCETCGHEYTDNYILSGHPVTKWEVINKPTTHREGLSSGVCDLCGITIERVEPTLGHIPLPPRAPQPVTQIIVNIHTIAPATWVLIALSSVGMIIAPFVLMQVPKGKRR